MHVIKVRNVHEALPEGLRYLEMLGRDRDSRNGKVKVAPGPVTTVYEKPDERVIFWRERNANPFFHFYEGLWMLNGQNDVDSVAWMVRRMATFSDDGQTLHGAYGHRWRVHFDTDQLQTIIRQLIADPTDRRCVLGMWDPRVDLGRQGKDVPCNTQAYFVINVNDELDMTVTCRSNDMIWGAYGANAVHFSMLHEFMARAIRRPLGKYYQMSNNFHAYHDTYEPLKHMADYVQQPFEMEKRNPYSSEAIRPYPMMTKAGNWGDWLNELKMFMSQGNTVVLGMKDPFFRRVAHPIMQAYDVYKTGDGEDRYHLAIQLTQKIAATDWRYACADWLEARLSAFLKAQDDGVSYE